MSSTEAKIEAAIEAHFVMPADIARLAGKLRGDLYNGPLYEMPDGEPACFGERGARQFDFQGAARIVNDWLDEHTGDVWYDVQCDTICEHEPEGFEDDDGEYMEPCWEDYYKVDARDVRRYLLGAELASTI